MIKHGILDIYEDVQLFVEDIKNGKRVNEEKEAMEKAAAEEIRQAAISTYKLWITFLIHELLQLDCYVGKLPCRSPRKKKKVYYAASPRVQHDISVEDGSSQTKSQVTNKTRSTSPTNNSSNKSTPSMSTDVDSII